MAVFTKLICRLSAILSKSQRNKIIKLNLKCSGNIKGQNNQDSFQKNKVHKLILLNFQNLLKAVVILTVQHWHKGRFRDQWSRTENASEHRIYCQLSFNKGAKTIQWRRNSLKNGTEATRYAYAKEWNGW